jgi:hypothetical protein
MTYEKTFNLVINVDIQDKGGYGSLRVSETFELGVSTFLEMCQILGRFHELAEKVKHQ